MSKKNKQKSMIVLLVAIVLATGVGIAGILSNILYVSASLPNGGIGSPGFEIYFLSLNKSKLENSAKSLAPDYQAIGAGGYIWQQDEYFHVFSSGYENKNDALLVQSNLTSTSNIISEIVCVKFNTLTVTGTFDAAEKKALQKAISSFQTTFQSLYDIAISLDTSVYNEISARLAVNAVHASISAICADFDTLFKNNDNATIQTIATYLNKEESVSKALCTGIVLSSKQTYSSLIKYRYIEILNLYLHLVNSLLS